MITNMYLWGVREFAIRLVKGYRNKDHNEDYACWTIRYDHNHPSSTLIMMILGELFKSYTNYIDFKETSFEKPEIIMILPQFKTKMELLKVLAMPIKVKSIFKRKDFS